MTSRRRIGLLAGSVVVVAAIGLAAWFHWGADPGAYGDVCRANLGAGQFEAAVASCQIALDQAQHAGDHPQVRRTAYGLAYAYWVQELYAQALSAGEVAWQAALGSNDAAAQQQVLLLLVTVLFDIGDEAGAETALRMAWEANPAPSPATWGHLRFNDGLLRESRGEFAAATTAYRDLLARAPEGHPTHRDARLNLVGISLEQGALGQAATDLAAADELVDKNELNRAAVSHRYYRSLLEHQRGNHASALRLAGEAIATQPPRDWTWRLHSARAATLAALGNEDAAIAAYRQAIDDVEALRADVVHTELKHWVLAQRGQPYEALFALLARRGAHEAALAVMERAKGRAVVDALIGAHGAPAPEVLPLRAAGGRAVVLQQIIPRLTSSPLVAPVAIDELLADLIGHYVLAYYEAEGSLWLAAVGDGKVRLSRLSAELPRLQRLAGAFRRDPSDAKIAAELGRLLIPPEVQPPLHTPLVISPAEGLPDLAFAALIVAGERLAQRHALSYTPSLTVLKGYPPGPSTAEPALVLGDPSLDLPAAAAEAQSVAGLLGVTALLGKQATSQPLRRAPRSQVVHLATHAGVDHLGAWLELADQRVYGHTLLTWRLQPRLAVLASCDSAAQVRLGVLGSLAGAFLAAGSQAVLASLGSVPDEATRDLVLSFYREGGVQDPVLGLARAQRQAMAAGQPVAVWASFVLWRSAVSNGSP